MRIVRFATGGRARYGVLDCDVVSPLRGPFAALRGGKGQLQIEGATYALGEVRLLAPIRPSKIVALGLNYRGHADEWDRKVPGEPLIFLKPSTAVIGPGETIIRPKGSRRVDFEGELAVVIGRRAREVTGERAGDYILGYTCANDVSERHMQKADGQWARAKGFDTFAPLGPWIETDVDPGNLRLTTALNGEVRQSAGTSDLVFPVPELVAFISRVMTLLPGDVILTGTPQGVGPMKAGDVVEVTIDGIGTLRNPVADA